MVNDKKNGKKIALKKPKFFDDFKAFIMKGNVLDMAVGIIIGIAFGAVVNSAVNDLIMPPIGYLLGGADFKEMYVILKDGTTTGPPYVNLDAAIKDGAVTFRYGLFINTVINFLIIALVIFLIVKVIAMMKKKDAAKAPTTRPCPQCDTQISLKAKRCPNCTSDVPPEKTEEKKADDEDEDEEDEK
jgi:large conductance mechanosensitive channel